MKIDPKLIDHWADNWFLDNESELSENQYIASLAADYALEQAAKVCDEQKELSKSAAERTKRATDERIYYEAAQTSAWNAAAIRALKEQK